MTAVCPLFEIKATGAN